MAIQVSPPTKLVKVGLPKLQLGQIGTNIFRSKTRNPTRIPSNLEITQIIRAAQRNRKVAETLAYINLLQPKRIDPHIRQTHTFYGINLARMMTNFKYWIISETWSEVMTASRINLNIKCTFCQLQ